MLPGFDEQSQDQEQNYKQNAKSHHLSHLIEQMSNWDHGYLKMRRSPDTTDLHLTWTWTLTAASGSYVYVKVDYWDIELGFDMLCRKVFEVDEGVRKPTPDKRKLR
jgi:hypothetical protein